jgi:hypothetical protein
MIVYRCIMNPCRKDASGNCGYCQSIDRPRGPQPEKETRDNTEDAIDAICFVIVTAVIAWFFYAMLAPK